MVKQKQVYLKELARQNGIEMTGQKQIIETARNRVLDRHGYNSQQIKEHFETYRQASLNTMTASSGATASFGKNSMNPISKPIP